LICFWGVREFHKLQSKYIDAIARFTGLSSGMAARLSLGLLNIYTERSKAKRLQKAYSRAIYRHVVVLIIIAPVWMLFGGWLLVILANLFLSVWSG
jgi:hypothetical protein